MSERTRHAFKAKRRSLAVNEPGVRTIGGKPVAARIEVVDGTEVVRPIPTGGLQRRPRTRRQQIADLAQAQAAIAKTEQRRFDSPRVERLMAQREASPLRQSFA